VTRLRPTAEADLDLVLALESDPANSPYIGRWTRAEHAAAIAAPDREHWTIERASDGERIGYLIAFDLRARGHGAFVKRIVVSDKGRGLGRAALGRFVAHAFDELGAPRVWLSVYRENERAQRSYRALGFAIQDLVPARRAELQAAVGGFNDSSFIMALERGAAR
jgi:diamine N-acetyltransferase